MDFNHFTWKTLEPGENAYITITNKKITSYYHNWSLSSYFNIFDKKVTIYLNIDDKSLNCDNHNKIIKCCDVNKFNFIQKIIITPRPSKKSSTRCSCC